MFFLQLSPSAYHYLRISTLIPATLDPKLKVGHSLLTIIRVVPPFHQANINKLPYSWQRSTDGRSPPETSGSENGSRLSEQYPVPSDNPATQYTLLVRLGASDVVAVKQIGNGSVTALACAV